MQKTLNSNKKIFNCNIYSFKESFLLIFIFLSTIATATNPPSNVRFGGSTTCEGYSGICTFNSVSGSESANSICQYDSNNNIITVYMFKTNMTNEQISKLRKNQLKKNMYVFNVDSNIYLPIELCNAFAISSNSFILSNKYIVYEYNNEFVMELIVVLD